jgi:hypothetical protein
MDADTGAEWVATCESLGREGLVVVVCGSSSEALLVQEIGSGVFAA